MQIIKALASYLSGTTVVPVSAANPLPVTATLDVGDVSISTSALEAQIGDSTVAAATQGGAGTVNAKLRLITSQLNSIAGYVDGLEALLGARSSDTVSLGSSTVPVSVTGTVIVASHAVTNAGTFAVQDSQVLGDDSVFTPGTSKVFPIGFQADETGTDSVDEGDVGCPRMTLDRKVHVAAAIEGAELRVAGSALTPKFAAIAAATSGDNTLVTAVSGKKIRVLAMFILAGAAGNIYFTSAASGTVIFGGSTNKINLPANGGFVLPFNPLGWFQNASNNEALVMNASSTGPFSGGLVYVEV